MSRAAGSARPVSRAAALVASVLAACGAVALPLAASQAAPPVVAAPSAAPGVASPARAPTPAAAYAEECAACHVAYPARLLATSQWSAVLSALDAHYGVDATVDPQTLALVARHLGVAGGVPHPGAQPQPTALPRITAQRWFVREHREANGMRGADKLSQCDACHSGATQGRFEEPGEEHERD